MELKTEAAEYVSEFSDCTTSPGYTEVVSSPLQTPVSGKALKGQRASRITKCNRAAPWTPTSNIGLLIKKFIELIKCAEDDILDLNKAAHTLKQTIETELAQVEEGLCNMVLEMKFSKKL